MGIIPSIISGSITIVISIIGWIISWRSSKRQTDQIKKTAAEESKKRIQDLNNMSEQVSALKKQADALEKQVRIEADRESVPKWDLHQSKGVIYELVNDNTHAAYDVRIEPVPGTGDDFQVVELGDITPGSGQTFNFVLAATMAAPDSVLISWDTAGSGERRTVQTAFPPYVRR